MRWSKRGLLFGPSLPQAWAASHAALPCVEPIGQGAFRMYYSSRDADNRSHIARARIRASGDALTVEDVDSEPVLSPGALGTFDQDGATVSCVVGHGDRRWLYYTGWTIGRTVPFHLAGGLALSDDAGATFRRASAAPVVDRNHTDPLLAASPSVMRELDGQFRMWYVSATRWEPGAAGPKHYYHVRYGYSPDGITWHRDGRVCIDFRDAQEHAISRPCVLRSGDRYEMWYSCRGEEYRLGYADSSDGLVWIRRDEEAGLDVSESGWDSQMIAYPWVFENDGVRFMLYNGNDYGASGIGYAVAVKERADD